MLLNEGEQGVGQLFFALAFCSSEEKYTEMSVYSVMFSWREVLLGKRSSFSVLTRYSFSHRNPESYLKNKKQN